MWIWTVYFTSASINIKNACRHLTIVGHLLDLMSNVILRSHVPLRMSSVEVWITGKIEEKKRDSTTPFERYNIVYREALSCFLSTIVCYALRSTHGIQNDTSHNARHFDAAYDTTHDIALMHTIIRYNTWYFGDFIVFDRSTMRSKRFYFRFVCRALYHISRQNAMFFMRHFVAFKALHTFMT